VKVWSGFGEGQDGHPKGQPKDYLQDLDEKEKDALARGEKLKTKLVLLTYHPLPDEINEIKRRDSRVKHVTWPEVARWFEEKPRQHLVSDFLVTQFLRFLKDIRLTKDKIGRDEELEKVIVDALTRANIPPSGSAPNYTSGGYSGWYLEEDKYYLTYHYKPPQEIYFGIDIPRWRKLNDKLGQDECNKIAEALKKRWAKSPSGGYGPCFMWKATSEGYTYDYLPHEDRVSSLAQEIERRRRDFKECLENAIH
jgi:hypothetical protein